MTVRSDVVATLHDADRAAPPAARARRPAARARRIVPRSTSRSTSSRSGRIARRSPTRSPSSSAGASPASAARCSPTRCAARSASSSGTSRPRWPTTAGQRRLADRRRPGASPGLRRARAVARSGLARPGHDQRLAGAEDPVVGRVRLVGARAADDRQGEDPVAAQRADRRAVERPPAPTSTSSIEKASSPWDSAASMNSTTRGPEGQLGDPPAGHRVRRHDPVRAGLEDLRLALRPRWPARR